VRADGSKVALVQRRHSTLAETLHERDYAGIHDSERQAAVLLLQQPAAP
jgi:hypothetical protein